MRVGEGEYGGDSAVGAVTFRIVLLLRLAAQQAVAGDGRRAGCFRFFSACVWSGLVGPVSATPAPEPDRYALEGE